MSEQPLEAVERLVVTILDFPCLSVRASDGNIYVRLGDLCDMLGLRSVSSQARRLRNDPDLRDGLVSFRARTAGGVQNQDFLLLDYFPYWLQSVDRSKAPPEIAAQIGYLRRGFVRMIDAAFKKAAGLPEGPSRQIEDLQDLNRIDTGIAQLAAQQRVLEEALAEERARAQQDRTEAEQRDRRLAERVKALEKRIGGTITSDQEGMIYQMVQVWGAARARAEGITKGEGIRSCWAAIKMRYRLASYKALPVERYDDCIQYIEASYMRLTGQPLQLPTQQGLGLDVEDDA